MWVDTLKFAIQPIGHIDGTTFEFVDYTILSNTFESTVESNKAIKLDETIKFNS